MYPAQMPPVNAPTQQRRAIATDRFAHPRSGCSAANSHHGTPWPLLTACPEPAVRPGGVQTSLPLADQVDEASAASGQLYWELPPPAPGLKRAHLVKVVTFDNLP